MDVLVVSPHMDDETLGAGGTILKMIDNGANVHWLNISNVKVEYGYESEYINIRHEQRSRVKKEMGFSSVIDLELEPAKLKKYDESEMIPILADHINKIKPEVLILPYGRDIHSDHKVVYDWCLPLTKSFRYDFIKAVYLMEIVSETDFAPGSDFFIPNYYVDITDYFEKKMNIVSIYQDQLKQHPFPRSLDGIESMSKTRGVVAGTKYAEAFQILRIIDK